MSCIKSACVHTHFFPNTFRTHKDFLTLLEHIDTTCVIFFLLMFSEQLFWTTYFLLPYFWTFITDILTFLLSLLVIQILPSSAKLSWDALHFSLKIYILFGTSLVAQWLRIHLLMQGTGVLSLVREDPTCHGATKPVRHNYWAHLPQLLKSVRLEPVLRNKRSHCDKTPAHHSEE